MSSSRLALITVLAATCTAAHAAPWSYQGRLLDGGQPANGTYDLQLTPYAGAAGGVPLAEPLTFEDVRIANGVFRVEGDFLEAAGAGEAWIEAAVRDGDAGGAFDPLDGRQKIALAPTVGACWATTGDSGTNPAVHFLGTTDQQTLVLRIANQQVARFEPSTSFEWGAPVTANVIQGAATNAVTAGVRGATIGGGGVIAPGADFSFGYANPNRATDSYTTIAGGADNMVGNNSGTVVDAAFASIGGGTSNTATAAYATIAGGAENGAGSSGSSVGGGVLNSAAAQDSTVAGGRSNRSEGVYSTVAGGIANIAAGPSSMVPGGQANCSGGEYSFAAGRNAKVRPSNVGTNPCGGATSGDANGDEGTFVWADALNMAMTSSGPNQFLVRADGGVFINHSQDIALADLTVGARPVSGDADSDVFWRSRDGRFGSIYLANADGSFRISAAPTGSTYLGFTNGAYLSAGGTFVNSSARAAKQDFVAVDPARVLEALLSLRVSSWRYRDSGESRHVGPVAEDFAAAFGYGDGRSIASVDADGIAFAAIQGLAARLEAENRELKSRLEQLERRLGLSTPP